MREEIAILAGGCYWGAEELLRRQPGIVSTRVGWSGGETPNPTDDNHGDHAEAVEITYDADITSYRDLLEFFFQIHDPTTLNRQGNETGRSVRSAIFYTSEEQRLAAWTPSPTSMHRGSGRDESSRRWWRRGRSGKPRRRTRITCRSIPMARRATSFARIGGSLAVRIGPADPTLDDGRRSVWRAKRRNGSHHEE